MEVKLEINLKDLCIISIADSLWNEEEIVNKTKAYLCSFSRYKKNRAWDLITKEVISQIDQESLPEFFYTELVLAVDSLGKKKRDFFIYCKRRNIFKDVPTEELYENYFKKIYWTYYGTIDVEKIVKSWFHNPKCDMWKVFVMASCYCSDEFIWEVWKEVKKSYSPESFEILYKEYGSHMAAYWDRYFNNSSDLANFIDDVKSKIWRSYFYCPTESAEKNMFKLAVGKGYTKIVRDFFSYLSEPEKEDNFLGCFSLALRHFNPDYDDDDDRPIKSNRVATFFRDDQTVEIFLFLLSCFDDLNNFLVLQDDDYESKNWRDYFDFNDFFPFLTRWPWIKLIVKFVNVNRKYLSYNNFEKLFELLIEKLRNENFPTSMANVYQKNFLELWETLQADEKQNLSKNIVKKLFSVWDFVSLKKILNDKDLSAMKLELLSEGLLKFVKFVEDDDEENIEKFISLLISGKWDKNIQIKMKKIYQNLLKCEFDLADKILNSFCCSVKEINDFKNTINSYVICCYFITRQEFKFADEFLIWKLNSKELGNYFKLNFIYHPFSVHHILKLWDRKKENSKEAKIQSNNFLSWFLKSEEEINNFITTKIQNTEELKKFIENSENGHYEIIDELLKWCLVEKPKRNSIKNNYLPKKQDLQTKIGYYMREYKWDAAQELLNWKFDCEIEKDQFLEKFFKSKKWAINCSLFLFNSYSFNLFGPQLPQDEMSEKVDKFIDLWMKPVSKRKTKYTREHLKNYLMNWPEQCVKMLEACSLNESGCLKDYSCDELDPDGSDYETDDEFTYDDAIDELINNLSKYYSDPCYFFDIDDLYFSDSSDDYRYGPFYGFRFF